MTAGRIEAITPDYRGDTLRAALIASDTEIALVDVTDFDEDGGWLVIGDSDPIAYLSVDDDANTVTLAAAVGAAYEEGLPVDIWDPTVPPEGAKLVEYVAAVDIDRGVVPDVVIPHAVIPVSGVDNLIGASVALEQGDSDDWFVEQVYGREPSVDQSYIATPVLSIDLAANQSIPHATTTVLTGWEAADGTNGGYFGDPMPDVTFDTDSVGITVPGAYIAIATVDWALNTSGSRQAMIRIYRGGVLVDETKVSYPPVDSGESRLQVSRIFVAQGDEEIQVYVRQGSGVSLAAQSGLTNVQVARFAS
jgi:hypothetical protein